MHDRLSYRRQFLLSKDPILNLGEWTCLRIDQHFLHVHPDLEVNVARDLVRSIVLIGCLFSPTEPEKRNEDILADLIAETRGVADFISHIKQYAGRYVLLYDDQDAHIILNDPLALREIYYCSEDNRVLCASQPNLIAEFASPKITGRVDRDFLRYFASHSKDSRWNPYCRWIGDETSYAGINHLLPNHYIDLKRRRIGRYWPNGPIQKLAIEEAVAKSCAFLQGGIEAMANRHSIMMAVTAGIDSRTLLAASKPIFSEIYYFVNNQGLGMNHPDISVPKHLFDTLNIPFHVHDVPVEVDKEFREIFLKNTFFASERILPTIYSVYYKDHSGKVNIIGIGEIGRTRFGKEPRKLNDFRIAYKMKYKNDQYAITQGKKILSELLPVAREFGLNVLTLLYWEHWLGNWGATGNSESDIAIEEINPFDSHLLYETLLGVDSKYSKYNNPVIFKEMIKKMWPDLADWPINPPLGFRNKLTYVFKRMGMYSFLKEIKYQAFYARYRFKLLCKKQPACPNLDREL